MEKIDIYLSQQELDDFVDKNPPQFLQWFQEERKQRAIKGAKEDGTASQSKNSKG